MEFWLQSTEIALILDDFILCNHFKQYKIRFIIKPNKLHVFFIPVFKISQLYLKILQCTLVNTFNTLFFWCTVPVNFEKFWKSLCARIIDSLKCSLSLPSLYFESKFLTIDHSNLVPNLIFNHMWSILVSKWLRLLKSIFQIKCFDFAKRLTFFL